MKLEGLGGPNLNSTKRGDLRSTLISSGRDSAGRQGKGVQGSVVVAVVERGVWDRGRRVSVRLGSVREDSSVVSPGGVSPEVVEFFFDSGRERGGPGGEWGYS